MTDTELQWRFIRARLIGHGMYLDEQLKEGILKNNLIHRRQLINSLSFRVNMEQSMAAGTLVIEFALHGRFQDMGAGKGSNKSDDFLDLFIGSRSARRKKKQWYNKTVWGTLNSLIYNLANDFTDETKTMLKKQILRYDKFKNIK